ncbi:hypothetical protein DL240_09835 [Lujinxingia litoralis]|uniref:Uncharacterized protein n=1 Tax=Lujinxingia litoralis TaxID=2211119 RepID=A0A328C561_9DELT|nr:hypothetical protein [Lujinxingia litoralis]RAL22146.1 hypothetical protein DL240_09835 [Lujinxingia litoralis]
MSEEANQSAQDNNPEGGGSSKRRRRRRRRRSRSSKGSNQTPQTQQSQQEDSAAAKDSGGSKAVAKSKARPRSNRSSRGSARRNSRNRSSGKRRPRKKTPVRKLKTPESKLGGREPLVDLSAAPQQRGPVELTPFELFCAYHCGITDNNNYRQQSLREVARRFNKPVPEMEQALRDFGLDKETVKRSRFDISLCHLDMKVAPEGIDKRELARVLFDEFLEETPKARERVEAFEAEASGE